MTNPKERLQEALSGLEQARREGIDIQLDILRRKALYPTLESMEARTREIRMRRAAIPLAEADQEVEHLLHHIDKLKAALRDAQRIGDAGDNT